MIRTAATVVLSILALYGVIKAVPLLLGPQINIEAPEQHATLPEGFMTLKGRAVHTQTLTLNGEPFLIDETGRFEETILLPRGGAILSLVATDRFGRSTSVSRTVYIP